MNLPDVVPPLPWLSPAGGDLAQWSLAVAGLAFGPADIIGQPDIERTNRLDTSVPARVFRGEATVRIRAGAADAESLRDMLRRAEAPIHAQLLLAGGGEPSVILAGSLAGAEWSGGAVAIRIAQGYPNADRLLCRDAGEFLALGDTPVWLPFVAGRVWLPMPPLFPRRTAVLAAALGIGDTAIECVDAPGWPAPGRVQIGDEVIAFSAVSGGGFALSGLSRPAARTHPRGGAIFLLPAEGSLRWCAADHPADVLAFRIGSRDGDPAEGTVAEAGLNGRAATIVSRDSLPLAMRRSRFPSAWESARVAGLWSLTEDSNGLDAMDAFTRSSPERGGVLARDLPRIAARWAGDATAEDARFDRIDAAWLNFEFSDTPGWGEATRLRVRIVRGASSIELDFDRRGFAHPVRAIGTAALPAGPRAASIRTERHRFHRVAATGSWSATASAIDGIADTAAELAAGMGELAASFAFDPPAFADVRAIRFGARLRNESGAAMDAELEVEIPALLLASEPFALAAGESRNIAFAPALPSTVGAPELFAPDARYRVRGAAGLAVEELWLDIDSAEAAPHSSFEDAVELPVEAILAVPIPYQRIRIDVAALMGDDAWGFLASGDEAPIVSFTLVDPPAGPEVWAVYVRDAHWEFRTFPATSAAPADALWAHVSGIGDDGGTADPEAILAHLVEQPHFGDATFSPSLNPRLAARGIRFAAAFAERLLLGDAFARATAEATALLYPAGDGWRAVPAMLDPERADPPEWPAGDTFEPEPCSAIAPPRQAFAMPPLRWAANGGDAIRRQLEARCALCESSLSLAAHPRWLNLPAGHAVGIAGLPRAAERTHGEAERIAYRGGSLALRIASARSVRRCFWSNGYGAVRAGGSLQFWAAGTLAAVLSDDGTLAIRGELREGAIAGANALGIFVADALAERLLALLAESGAAATLAFCANGDLLSSVPFAETSAIDEAAPSCAAERRNGLLAVGGAPNAALVLTASAAQLRGRILANQDLLE